MLQKLFNTPAYSIGFITFISAACLASAFIAEAIFLLEPCELCIYQRYPYAFVILLGLIGFTLRKRRIAAIGTLVLSSIAFLINSGIAFYHTGVEQHWWTSAVEGCANPFIEHDDSSKSILENLMSAPLGDCSVIPWQDPILGLSMANYNIGVCFMLALFCLISAFKIKKHPPLLEES